jgi:MFS family permease
VLVGPAIGGLITGHDRLAFVFFLNSRSARRVLPSSAEPALYHLRGDKPKIDYLGAALFTLRWCHPRGPDEQAARGLGGPVVAACSRPAWLILVVFVLVESRVGEPIVPLDLFRNRSFTVSVTAFFLASFGFFATGRLLPRWFQVVAGRRRRSRLPDAAAARGLIFSAVGSARSCSQRPRIGCCWRAHCRDGVRAVHAQQPPRGHPAIPVLWAWMVVTGLGVGPTFAVFTLVVQNNVPVERIGTATSNLTFFQQVGGTVGLARDRHDLREPRWPTAAGLSSSPRASHRGGRALAAPAAGSTR